MAKNAAWPVEIQVPEDGKALRYFETAEDLTTGRFRDVEAPARRMLELDRLIERGGEIGGPSHG